MIKQGDKFIIDIIRLGSNGEGVAQYNGYTLFVPYCLVGEQVRVRVDHVKRNIAYATMVEVIRGSDSRVQPPCMHFGKCGGCQLQHMDYNIQLQYKLTMVQDTLAKLGSVTHPIDKIISSNPYGYRNKLSLPIGGKRGDCIIGMYQIGTHNIVQLDHCVLSRAWAQQLIAITKNFVDSQLLTPYNESRHSGQIRHVVGRYHNEQLLVTMVTNGNVDARWDILYGKLCQQFGKCGLLININDQDTNVILGKVTKHLYGIDCITGISNDVKYSVRANSFFQVNDSVKDMLYSRVRQLVSEVDTDALVDCFSGVGLLTGEMYSDSYDSYAIEIDSSSVADANHTKQVNNLTRLTNICGDANVELPRIMDSIRQTHTNSNITLIVDPPRKGLGSTIVDSIIKAMPTTIVYISCDPATLARDLKGLGSSYDIQLIELYDMFPHTRHVETLVLLAKL